MKRNAIVLGILAGLFLISSVVMTILFVKQKSTTKAMTQFSMLMVESFSNAVDYSICDIDRQLGNVTSARCDEYLTVFGSDIQKLKEEFGMTTKYKYIGE